MSCAIHLKAQDGAFYEIKDAIGLERLPSSQDGMCKLERMIHIYI
jgi:hypothetical protein